MLGLSDITFFSKLSSFHLNELSQHVSVKEFEAGEILFENQDAVKDFFALAEGLLVLEKESETLFVHPGDCLSEMTLLGTYQSNLRVKVIENSKLFVIPKEVISYMEINLKTIYHKLTKNLTNKLEHKKVFGMSFETPQSIFVVKNSKNEFAEKFCQILFEKMRYYSSNILFEENLGDNFKTLVKEWKERGFVYSPKLFVIDLEKYFEIRDSICEDDQILFIFDKDSSSVNTSFFLERSNLSIVNLEGTYSGELWSYRFNDLLSVESQEGDHRHLLDRLARRLLNKEIGIALGAGAARGFAHLGVLSVLEENKIPVDFLSGTSIGGAVAITYALTGSAKKTIELLTKHIGARKRVQDLSLLPRQSLLKGKKLKRAAEVILGAKSFTDLLFPVKVVASDIGHAQEYIFKRGKLSEACLGTSAIPGIFPPLIKRNRILVDGALVNKVPVNLLLERKCALSISVNATIAKGIFSCDPDSKFSTIPNSQMESAVYELSNSFDMNKGINLGSIINNSWDLLSWSEASNQAFKADIALSPETHGFANFAFDEYEELIKLGREAALAKLPAIKVAVTNTLAVDKFRKITPQQ